MPDDRGSQPPEPIVLSATGATELAQAGDGPVQIGIAETVNGEVTVVHPDGASEALTTGAPILAGDRLQTGGDGDVAVIFEDESVMALGPESDLVIDEMVYDPAGPDGSMLMTVSEGVFSFVSGAIAKVDPEAMTIQTPSVVIGIRGTSLAANVRPEGEPSSYTLVDDPDGTVGEAVLQNAGGVQVINQIGQTVEPTSFFAAPPPPRLMPPEELAAAYGGAIDALPAAFRPPVAGPPPPPRGQNEDGGNQGQGQAAAEEQAAADDGGNEGEADADTAEESAGEEAAAEDEVADEELTPEELAALEADAEAAAEDEQTPEDGLIADDEATGDADTEIAATDGEDAAADDTAFSDALAEADPFDGNEEAAAAAEAAFNEALADGASLDEATQAALEAGTEVAATTEPTVETESVDETAVINEMTSTVDYNTGNIFSAPVAGSSLGTASVSGPAFTTTATQVGASAGTDGGDDGFADDGEDDGEGELSVPPPPPPPPPETETETEPDPSPEPAPDEPVVDTVVGSVPVASSAELFTLEGVVEGAPFRISDAEDGPSGLSVSISTQPTGGSVTAAAVASQASVASQAGIASRASSASQASVGSMAAAASVGSVGVVTTRASVASIASIAAQASISSHASIASRASQASQAEAGLQFFVPSQASFASQASIASQALVASAASRASVASVGSTGSAASVASYASMASQASHAGAASFAAVDGQASQASFAGESVYDYQPDLGFTGSDTFVYSVTDSDNNTTTASVSVTVNAMTIQAASGTDIDANPSVTTAAQSHASVAAGHFGQYIVVFNDINNGDIYAQRFDSSGATLGTEFLVNTNSGTASTPAGTDAVAAVGGGDYVVVWQSNHAGTYDIYMQRFTSLGDPIGGETRVNGSAPLGQVNASVAALDDSGRYVVTWSGDNGSTQYDVFAAVFDGGGTKLTEVTVASTTDTAAQTPQVAGLENGGFVVGWSAGDGSTNDAYVRIYDSDGANPSSAINVTSDASNLQSEVSVAGLNDGGFIVVWTSDASGDNDIFAQRYDSAGTAQGGMISVDTTATTDQQNASVTALEDGGWMIAWESFAAETASTYSIMAQRYNSDGTTNGSTFAINSTAPTSTDDQLYPALATVEDGGFVTAWHSSLADGADSGVWTNVFHVGASSSISPSGTAGNDAYIGSILADVIDSLAGDDSIFGMAGNDVLTGGDGNDLIQGGPGDDTIDGGAGNDLLYGESGTDTITGGAGEDQFFFDAQTANSTVLDFTPGTDTLIIDHSILGDEDIVFEQLTSVTYDGTNATDPNANVIVDDQGDVYHDSNGNVAGGYTLIGTVEDGASGVPTMTSSDVDKS